MSNTDQQKETVKTGYAPSNGLDIYYEIHGQGTPLVLIHGGGSDIDVTFGRILPFLSKHYLCIGIDLQAHGHTPDRGTPTSFEEDADDVFAVMQHLEIANAHIFGFSNGANTALQLAARHPEAVNRLVAASAFYKREGLMPGFFDGFAESDISMMPQALQDAYLAKNNNDKKGLQTMFERDRDRMANFSDWPETLLRSIKAKTLYLVSYGDMVLPQHALEMAAKTPGAEAVVLRGYHGEFMGELLSGKQGSRIPELSTELIREFLDAE